MTAFVPLCVLAYLYSEEVRWGRIEFTKVGPDGAEYRQALREAAKSRRRVMIFFTCGCKPCQGIGSGLFSDDGVARMAEGCVRLIVRGHRELQDKYKVDACPHVVFLDPAGKELRVFRKPELLAMKPEEFRARMREVLAASRIAQAMRRLAGWW